MITEELLISKGFKKQIFFYQIGGGEDEDDTYIFINDDVVVFWDHYYKVWRKNIYSKINYVNGLDWDGQVCEETDL